MELQITGTNMELTPPVRSYAERKLGKLNQHFPNIILARVEISEEKTKSPQQHYLIRVTVDGNGAVFHGEARGEDMFRAVDKVTATMTRQLEHHKGKLYQKGRGSSFARGELSEEEVEDDEPTPVIVRAKRFAIKPMSTTEAAEQMELLDHDFFLFLNAEADEINLLYRRKDGNYGLIEPDLG
ncbi:ribosome hibernation-promoting factor, HPF/YfiA family [Chloroflexota bacterium]